MKELIKAGELSQVLENDQLRVSIRFAALFLVIVDWTSRLFGTFRKFSGLSVTIWENNGFAKNNGSFHCVRSLNKSV